MRNFVAGFASALLLVAAVGVLANVRAEEVWAVMSGIAVHLDGREHCNSVTTGLGVERGTYSAGFYRNSNCRWSTYAAKAWLPLQYDKWRGGLLGGAVTGYANKLTPVLAFAATFENKNYGLNIIGIPPAGGSSGGVLWFQVKRRW